MANEQLKTVTPVDADTYQDQSKEKVYCKKLTRCLQYFRRKY